MACTVLSVEGEVDEQAVSGGVTLLSQLANMPSMSPLITSPVPSVGSVVPNMRNPSIIISNGVTQQTPEVSQITVVCAQYVLYLHT